MIYALLLLIIYLAYVSLGLPDQLLGVAWPFMRIDLGAPIEAAGVFSIVTTIGTSISGLASGHLIRRLGIGKVTAISCALTAAAIFGLSISPNLALIYLCLIPLGMGGGAIDVALNNYVSDYYSSTHMNWLHCCWGIGAFIGPLVMTKALVGGDWRQGYMFIGAAQTVITLVLAISIPLWKRNKNDNPSEDQATDSKQSVWQTKGAVASIFLFFVYVGIEYMMGLWSGSLLIEGRAMDKANAGILVSTVYIALTVGRFFSGILVRKVGNRRLIILGAATALVGALFYASQVGALTAVGMALIGLGYAPIFPCMVHETSARFRNGTSSVIMGYQVGTGYIGAAVLPVLFGFIASRTTLELLPYVIAAGLVLIIVLNIRLNKVT